VDSAERIFKTNPALAHLSFGKETFSRAVNRTSGEFRKRTGSPLRSVDIRQAIDSAVPGAVQMEMQRSHPHKTALFLDELKVREIGKTPGYHKAFFVTIERLMSSRRVAVEKGRYRAADSWLKEHSVKSFLDVGCGAALGAESTHETKLALGRDSRVVGMGISDFKDSQERTVEQKGFEFRKESILKTSLKTKRKIGLFDAVRIGYVHPYLNLGERRALFENALKNLRRNGYLLIAPPGGPPYEKNYSIAIYRKGFFGVNLVEKTAIF